MSGGSVFWFYLGRGVGGGGGFEVCGFDGGVGLRCEVWGLVVGVGLVETLI